MKKLNSLQSNAGGTARRHFASILSSALLLMGASAMAVAPVNDDFANATVVPASSTGVTGSNAGATLEPGEPDHVSAANGTNSVWWVWTPTVSAPVTIDTSGSPSDVDSSGLDTQLAVYTGSSLNSLTQIASSEDTATDATSLVTFNAVAGTTYHIAVAGYNNEPGTVHLNFTTGTAITGFTLTVSTTGGGTVTKSPAQPAAGYTSNQVVTLTATPTGTNTFIGWGGDAAAFGSTNPITLTMDGNKTASAAFTTNSSGGATTFVLSIQKTPTSSSGTITKSPNKTRYNAGEVVTVVARPAGGRSFLGWTGTDEASSDRTNHITILGNTTITAAFSGVSGPPPNVYSEVVGTYAGLFYPDTGITQDCSGYFTIRVAKPGKFTGRFVNKGKSYTTKGQFDANGDATAPIGRGTDAASVTLHVDLSGGTDQITGTLTTTDCVAQLIGDRQEFSARNLTPLAGTYTVVFPRNATNEVVFDTNNVPIATNTVVVNQGHGYAILTISRTGQARIRGALADGSVINQSTILSKNGQIPLYVSLYRGQGHLIGWLDVTATDVTGTVNWFRPAGGLVFPEGLDANIAVLGSRFDRTRRPLATFANPMLEIGGNSFVANGEAPLVVDLDTGNNNTLIGTGGNPNGVSLRIAPSGLVTGRFSSPITSKKTVLRGVVLQNVNAVYGYYLGTGARGY
ncbi:MAG: hypothetical protein ABIV39_11690, partial [Verrucomicrobiota bacterium]